MSLSIIKTHETTGFWLRHSNSPREQGMAEELAAEIKDREFDKDGFNLHYLATTILEITAGGHADITSNLKGVMGDLITLVAALDEEEKFDAHHTAGKTIYALYGMIQLIEAIQYRTSEQLLFYHALTQLTDCADVRWVAMQYYEMISGATREITHEFTTEQLLERIQKHKK